MNVQVIDPGVRIPGVDDMLERFGNSERLTLCLTILIPVIPASNRHKAPRVERCNIGVIGILCVELAHLGQISPITLARVRNTFRVIKNIERVDQRGLHGCRSIDAL